MPCHAGPDGEAEVGQVVGVRGRHGPEPLLCFFLWEGLRKAE